MNALCDQFLLACRKTPELAEKKLNDIRKSIVLNGGILDGDTCVEERGGSVPKNQPRLTLRGKLWMAMLGLDRADSSEYSGLIKRGNCECYAKIRSDTFRTFPEEKEFVTRVSEGRLVRLLNSFVLLQSGEKFTYEQGMNAIAAPLLFCMPEVDAFYSFCKIITRRTPLYFHDQDQGLEAACELVDRILPLVDPELDAHLKKTMTPPLAKCQIYGYSCLMSLSASVPPFQEMLKLWDFLFAFGFHMNVACLVAQLVLLRDQLFAAEHPKSLLDYRKWPPLRAKETIQMAMVVVEKLTPELRAQLCLHATDPKTCEQLLKESQSRSASSSPSPQQQA